LISRGNGSLALVGRGGLVDREPDEVAFPDTMIRARVDPGRVNRQFLRLVWDSEAVRRQIERAAKTTAGIYKVNQGDLARVAVPLPPLHQQLQIVAELERMATLLDSLTVAIRQALLRSDRLKRSILTQAFAGQLVGRARRDVPALEVRAGGDAARINRQLRLPEPS
jgi:type I restriction enzyme S subunit